MSLSEFRKKQNPFETRQNAILSLAALCVAQFYTRCQFSVGDEYNANDQTVEMVVNHLDDLIIEAAENLTKADLNVTEHIQKAAK